MKYRKKPVVIEAFQLTPEVRASNETWPLWACEAWQAGTLRPHLSDKDSKHASPLIIATLEGSMEASIGDFIIRGLTGELYPCKPDIFAASYDGADADAVTVTLQIGNSDDKLTQREWHDFNYSIAEAIRQHASQVHFHGEPSGSERWQNAAWVFVIETANIPGLKSVVAYLRAEYQQDSVAWTEGGTAFV